MTATNAFALEIAHLVAEQIKAEVQVQRKRRLLTCVEAADYLGVSDDTIRNLHAAEELPTVRINNRKLHFDIEDLDKLIADRKSR